jgi:hypothetical protein
MLKWAGSRGFRSVDDALAICSDIRPPKFNNYGSHYISRLTDVNGFVAINLWWKPEGCNVACPEGLEPPTPSLEGWDNRHSSLLIVMD